jgi:hypothetical protein
MTNYFGFSTNPSRRKKIEIIQKKEVNKTNPLTELENVEKKP